MSHNLKIVFLNVYGLSNPVKRSRVLAKTRKDKSNVIYFTRDTHVKTNFQLETAVDTTSISRHSSPKSKDLNILIREQVNLMYGEVSI